MIPGMEQLVIVRLMEQRGVMTAGVIPEQRPDVFDRVPNQVHRTAAFASSKDMDSRQVRPLVTASGCRWQ